MYPYFYIFGKQFTSYSVMAVVGAVACLIYTLIRARQKKLDINDLMYYLTFAFGFLAIGAIILHQIIEIITN